MVLLLVRGLVGGAALKAPVAQVSSQFYHCVCFLLFFVAGWSDDVVYLP